MKASIPRPAGAGGGTGRHAAGGGHPVRGRAQVISAVVVCCIALVVWVVAAPTLAARFGWATAWPHNLPGSVTFHGRDYVKSGGCVPRPRTPLRGTRGARIGSLPVVLGSSLPILDRYPLRPGDPAAPILIVAAGGNCYVFYALRGGP